MARRARAIVSGASLCALLCACTKPTPPPAPPNHYADPTAWLCLPGPSDHCAHDLTTTQIDADGSTHVVVATASNNAPVDCFYVYPTVDLSLGPANHDDFSDLGSIERTTNAQVGRFAQLCRLYVPLYRQVTIGAYLRGGDRLRSGLDLAYSDVAAAFRHYLATYNGGRPIVLLGHSQGAEMITRLLREFFDDDASLRARLVVAMPLGGHLEVPAGQRTGGTFHALPACAAPGETGCVIAFRSYEETEKVPDDPTPIPAGHEPMCVNPGNLAAPDQPAAVDAVLPYSDKLDGVEAVKTPYVSYPALFRVRCAHGALAITETLGQRKSPVDLGSRFLRTKFGTHVLDYQIAQDQLVDIARQAIARFN